MYACGFCGPQRPEGRFQADDVPDAAPALNEEAATAPGRGGEAGMEEDAAQAVGRFTVRFRDRMTIVLIQRIGFVRFRLFGHRQYLTEKCGSRGDRPCRRSGRSARAANTASGPSSCMQAMSCGQPVLPVQARPAVVAAQAGHVTAVPWTATAGVVGGRRSAGSTGPNRPTAGGADGPGHVQQAGVNPTNPSQRDSAAAVSTRAQSVQPVRRARDAVRLDLPAAELVVVRAELDDGRIPSPRHAGATSASQCASGQVRTGSEGPG